MTYRHHTFPDMRSAHVLRSPFRDAGRPATTHGRRRLGMLLFSAAGRPARFALTGGLAGLCQLALLSALTRRGWAPDVANVVAFLLAAQLNFVLSATFTWRDRLARAASWRAVRRRWLT